MHNVSHFLCECPFTCFVIIAYNKLKVWSHHASAADALMVGVFCGHCLSTLITKQSRFYCHILSEYFFLMMCVSLPTCNVTSRRIKHHSTKQKSSQTGVINTLLSFNHQNTLKIQWNRNFQLTKSEEPRLQDSLFSLWETSLLLRKKKGLNFSCICESYIHHAVQVLQPLCVSLQSHLFYCFMAKVLYEKKTIIYLVRQFNSLSASNSLATCSEKPVRTQECLL